MSRQRLPVHVRRDFDEEDVALSAFHSLCEGVKKGQFPDLGDRHDLWAVLVVITARKSMRRLRARAAQCRGGGDVQGETALGAQGDDAALARVVGDAPTPAFAAEVAEESERLLDMLPDNLREVAELRCQGLESAEIASQLACGLRTVERRLMLIRRIWTDRGDDDA